MQPVIFDTPWTPNSGLLDFYIPTMQFRFVGEKEIVALIKSLPTNKSSQVEHISMKFLKDALLITNFETCHLINVCMTRSIMPDSWKIGTISSIPKKGLSQKVTDNRLNFGKFLKENCNKINLRLASWVKCRNILPAA